MGSDAMDRDSPSDTYPAPYGRACLNCSQSKCKCLYPKAGGRCQRCQRLNKDCRQPSSHRRQNTRKSPTSKAARLEEKLEDLVSLLRAGVQPPPGGNAVTALLGQYGQGQDIPANAVSPPDSIDAALSNSVRSVYYAPPNAATLTPDTSTPDAGGTVTTAPSTVASPSPFEPTAVQAEEYLTLFHSQLLPYFPCVHVPPGATAQQLRQERPFTWLCIMAVASRVEGQRRALYEKIKNIVAQQMIHNSSNNDIDILLGLLIYLGWSNQQVYNKANIHVFTQLANAAVYELGIQSPAGKPNKMALCVHSEGEEGDPAAPVGQTMEERRAVLGCFLITSIISTFLQKTDALRWTPYMDECLQVLEEQQECLNDDILVQQVRLQLIIDKLSFGPHHGGSAATLEPILAPPAFYLRPMQTQLNNVQPRIAPHSQGYKILLLHHHNAAVILHESALTRTPMPTNHLNFQMLEWLYACLDATKSWFDVFLSIPPVEYIGFPFSVFSQMVHNLVVLYQLSTFEDPAWDTAAVRRTADILAILDSVIYNMSQVAVLAGMDGEPDTDVFSRVAKMYRSVRMGWEAKLGTEPFLPPGADPAQALPEPLEAMPLDFPQVSDNDWLSDMLNSIAQSNRFP
ncbi:hypothetical protein BDV25DRAFT_162216 [Aspergillus avenaceus]|uniref:Zn(2)-C6 fungal-type domain-containing protein n=1 Tax=Aspergillus avenaceus TaxID=36643 RepID=A0A5N6TKE3_ASPAV|nr:hypothetical protein BDV25DRAFT_162216 [Aspergillus avenaceus]